MPLLAMPNSPSKGRSVEVAGRPVLSFCVVGWDSVTCGVVEVCAG
jgi:hypothetical protein